MLLTEDEQAAKSDIWHEVNKAFLEDWSHREAQRKKDKEEAAKREPRPKRKPLLPAANAVEATQLALQKVRPPCTPILGHPRTVKIARFLFFNHPLPFPSTLMKTR